jgi:hypothetical protein
VSNRRRLRVDRLAQYRDRLRPVPVTRWNGEPCEAERGTAVVSDDGRFPDYWARRDGLVGERVALVRVVYGGSTSYLLDDEGQGWAKVTTGGGSPRVGHKNVTIEEGSWTPGS